MISTLAGPRLGSERQKNMNGINALSEYQKLKGAQNG
jgi:hypothetical protein